MYSTAILKPPPSRRQMITSRNISLGILILPRHWLSSFGRPVSQSIGMLEFILLLLPIDGHHTTSAVISHRTVLVYGGRWSRSMVQRTVRQLPIDSDGSLLFLDQQWSAMSRDSSAILAVSPSSQSSPSRGKETDQQQLTAQVFQRPPSTHPLGTAVMTAD